MIRFIALAALATLINATSASAQTVLTNGGFEQSPPNSYGNNAFWPIAPWVLTAGGSNVVSVDGPGGSTWYGSYGPASDATGGTGNFQHYLDQYQTAGVIYQEFTPLCSGEVQYGAYFSSRGNATGFADVTIKDATGANIVSGPAGVTVPGGNSETDPWQLASFTASLTAGTTYRFEVDMDNQLNMDNAYVAFGPECSEHTNPDWSDPTDETEPDPVPAQCTPFTQEDATCDAATGEITITLDNALTGSFDPNDLGVECLTPGVTVAQNPFNPLELIITGATAGQTVLISTNAVQEGAGNGTGLDLCCTGEVEIIIPETMICEAPADLSIAKIWNDVILHDDGSLPPHGFEITVDLELGTLAAGDVITVDDPASGQINVTAFGTPVAPTGWTCSITAGSWTCQYIVPSTGAVLPATIIYPSIIDSESHVLNCASVSVATSSGSNPDTNDANNNACWEVNAPPSTDETSDDIAELTVEKICSRQPSMGSSILFACEITVTSTGPITDPIDLTDTFGYQSFNGDANGLVGQLASPDPWACNTAPYSTSNAPECTISAADFNATGGTSTLSTFVMVQQQDLGETDISNCAQIVNDAAEPDPSCAILSSAPEESELSITKACSPMPISGETEIPCQITVTGTGPANGWIAIGDEYINPNFNGDLNGQIGQISGPSEWTCESAPYGNGTWPSCTISTADFAAMGGTATFTTSVTVSPDDMGEGVQNCAIVGYVDTEVDESCVDITANNPVEDTTPDESQFEVVKTCEPLVLQPDEFEMTIDCSISVTPQAPFDGTITINDVPTQLSGVGDMFQNPPPVLSYDTSVWNCTTNLGATCTADGSTYPVDGNGMPQTTTIDITLSIFNVGGVETLQNCAEGNFAPTSGAPVDFADSCVTETYDMTACVPVPEIAGDQIDNDCDGDVDEVDQADNTGEDAQTPEFNIFKDCDNTFTPVAGTDQLTVNCAVQVTPLTAFTGTLSIDDSATNSAGGGQAAFTSITGYDTNIWSCNTTNAAGFSCSASGANYPVDGNGWPLTTTFNTVLSVDNTGAETGGSVSWNNCAGGTYVFNTGQTDNVSSYCDLISYDNPQCTPVPEIVGDQIDNDCDGEVDETTTMRQSNVVVPELALTKEPLGDCIVNETSQTYSCDFALTVENTGTDPFTGPLHILDAFGSPTPRNVGGVTSDGWQCLTGSDADQMSCLAPMMPLETGVSTTVEMSLTIPGIRNGGTFENCAAFAVPENAVLQAKIVQTLLNTMGIDVGTVDGAVGPNTRAGIVQFQRQSGLPETGEVSVALLQALGLNPPAGQQTCVSVSLPPMPEPPLTCDPSTTVLIDGACECRFSRMIQSSASSCSCIQGTQLDAGRGCFRPERQISEPRRPSSTPSTPSTPRCPAGSTFNAARGECVAPASRPTCGDPNQIMVNGSCRCARGYVLRSGSCREERRSSGGGGTPDLP